MDLEDLFLRFISQYHEVLRESDLGQSDLISVPDVTIRQYFYLQEIGLHHETTLTSIAQALSITKPTATAAITKLVKDGYVIRTQSTEDQRKYILSLSERGNQVFERKQKAYRKFVAQIRNCTTNKQQKILEEAFEIMSSCFQNSEIEENPDS